MADSQKPRNVGRATAVGITAGGTGAAVISWGATEIERRYGVPAPVAASVLGTFFGFVARWAAKLNPHA